MFLIKYCTQFVGNVIQMLVPNFDVHSVTIEFLPPLQSIMD